MAERGDVSDPVFEYEDLWYFWDETETVKYGPYKTEEGARKELARYGHYLNTGEYPPATPCNDCTKEGT